MAGLLEAVVRNVCRSVIRDRALVLWWFLSSVDRVAELAASEGIVGWSVSWIPMLARFPSREVMARRVCSEEDMLDEDYVGMIRE